MSTNEHYRNDVLALTFFNDWEAQMVEAICDRIIPGDEGGVPGATEAGSVYYIDRTITGYSTILQRIYRLGLREIDRYSIKKFGRPLLEVGLDERDATVRDIFGPEVRTNEADHEVSPVVEGSEGQLDLPLLRRFLAVVREHAIEGFFCDPIYGGNRNAVGWRLVGFPGAQWGYTAEQMKPGYDASQIAIKTLGDLRRDLPSLPDNKQFYENEK